MLESAPLLAELARSRRITDALFAQVKPEAFFDRPIPERHRILFYLGHLEAFDWNQVGRASLGLSAVDDALDRLFAFGIDPPPGELPSDRVEDWPTLEEARAYARSVRVRLDEVAGRASDESLHIAIEHRLMHAETFGYILHNLPCERRLPISVPRDLQAPEPAVEWVTIPEGSAQLGRARGTGFGWDNEFGEHAEHVASFTMARYKVTNGEYLAFVEEGGPAPHYWARRGNEWRYRGMWSERPLPPHWPVYVSHEQATAFAAWRGTKLPTEAQFQRAAFGAPGDASAGVSARRYPWGDASPTARHGCFDFTRPDPVPVNATPDGDSAFGVSQLVGNGWEWTRSVFAPFPGFVAHATYPGYSANFFDEGHYVMKGASPLTDRALLRPTFRNWFRPHYPYAYSTFRLVEE